MHHLPASRRQFLSILLGFSAWALITPIGTLFGLNQVGVRDRMTSGLGDFFKHRKSAGVVGLEYLKQAPMEGDIYALLDRIFEGSAGRRFEFAEAGAGRRREMLLEQNRNDFARGRVVKVEGWILSLTEARLCALAALLRTPG